MDIEQIEVFVQYACGDTVKVTVPSMSVGIPVVPAFTMPVIGECPEGTMAIPKTYVSEPYPVLSNDMLKASNDVLGLFMKYISVATEIPADKIASSSNLQDIYLKNINIGYLCPESLSIAADIPHIYLKNINIYCGNSSNNTFEDSVVLSSDVNLIEMISLNRYYTVSEGVTASSNIDTILLEASPRTEVTGNEPDGIESKVPELVSAVYTVFASLDNLQMDKDGVNALVPEFVNGVYTTFQTYERYQDKDGVVPLVPEYISGVYTTYTEVDLSNITDGTVAVVPEFVSGVLT